MVKAKAIQILYGLGASVGAFLVGCSLGWTTTRDYEYDKSWSITLWWANVCVPISAIIFTKLAGFYMRSSGPVATLKIATIVFFVCNLLFIAYFWKNEQRTDFDLFIVYRIGLGLGCAIVSVAIPLCICEMAQKEIRGTIGCFYYFLFTTGVLAAYSIFTFGSFTDAYIVGFVVTLVYLKVIHFKPDSPLYLIKYGEEEKASIALRQLRGPDYDIKDEMQMMKAVVSKSQGDTRTFWQKLTSSEIYRPLLFGIGLMFFQQFSGIHTVLSATDIVFEFVIDNKINPQYSVLFVGAVDLFGCLLAIILVDRIGRRLLLLISIISMTVIMFILGIIFSTIELTGIFQLVLLILFVFAFSIGFGPIPWIMIAELFTFQARARGISAVVACSWLFWFLNFDVIVIIEFYNAKGEIFWSFWFYFIILVFGCVFVFFLPETNQKSLMELEDVAAKKTKGPEPVKATPPPPPPPQPTA